MSATTKHLNATTCADCSRPIEPSNDSVLPLVLGGAGFLGGIVLTVKMGWTPWGQWYIPGIVGFMLGQLICSAWTHVPEPEGGWCKCGEQSAETYLGHGAVGTDGEWLYSSADEPSEDADDAAEDDQDIDVDIDF